MELSPSEECHQRILEKARSQEKTNIFQKRVKALSRIGYAIAACLLLSVLSFAVASGMFNENKYGVYYNGEKIESKQISFESKTVEYTAAAVIARSGAQNGTEKLFSSVSVPLELCSAGQTTASVSVGTLLVYSDNAYHDVGSETVFTNKALICWVLPEGQSGSYELRVNDRENPYIITVTYNAESNLITAKAK